MWDILFTEVYEQWLDELDEPDKISLLAVIQILSEKGPSLGRPYVDSLKGSKLSNLKELRVQSRGRPLRSMFVFDPERRGIMLCGGDKSGDKRFYKRMIELAENEYHTFSRLKEDKDGD